MSDETDKTQKIHSLSLSEFLDQWPKSDDGRLAGRLLQRYCYTLLVDSAIGNDCGPMTAQAESGAMKAIAKMTKDFASLAVPGKEKKKPVELPTLNRFRDTEAPNKNETP